MSLVTETIVALDESANDISAIYDTLFRFARRAREAGMPRADVAATLGTCIARSSLPTWLKNRLPDLFVRVDGCAVRLQRSERGHWWQATHHFSVDVTERYI